MRLRAALFDVFGTLLDVYSVTRRAEALFPGHGARLAVIWRDKQIEYSRLRTLSGRYAPFSQVTPSVVRSAFPTFVRFVYPARNSTRFDSPYWNDAS